jgi:M6 family metalloprotease-like protein
MDGDHSEKKKIILPATLFIACLVAAFFFSMAPALALQPASPEEIQQLKAKGEFKDSLENALKVGNHKVSPHLVQKFKSKAKKLFEKSNDLSVPEMDEQAATLPPGRQGGLPSSGSPKIFALLIEFQDETHINTAADIDDMLFDDGDVTNFPRESLTSYYDRASYGILDLSGGTTLGWYQTAYDRTTVTQTGAGREALIKEVLNHFDSNGHDFSQYDNDGDGDIEYFIVLWAGPNGAWATFWWGWNLGWSDGAYIIDGKTLSNYSWQRESGSPTVVIHETGHSLGLPDLYDYDNATGPGGGVGGFDPMDSNISDPNCFWKWMLDWATPTVVAGGREDITLDDMTTSEDCVLIWPGVVLGDIFSEFYMVQNRQAVSNDTDLWFTPDGLSVWHVDATLDSGGNNFAYNNSTTSRKLVRLMEADGLEEIETTSCCSGCTCKFADSGDLYTDGDDIGPATTPSSDKYDGTDSCVRVYNIEDLGTPAGDEIASSFSTVCNTPPVCDANGPYTEECQGVETDILVDGSGSFDPDPGDMLTHDWTTNCSADILSPTAETSVMTVDTLPGCAVNCDVFLTVTDTADDDDSCSSSVNIVDSQPPDVTCPGDLTIECDESSEPDATGFASATDICDPGPVSVEYSDVITPGACPQEYTIARTWAATDACNNMESCDQIIAVVDTTAPVIDSASASPKVLWPPNHKMKRVTVAVQASDNCDPEPICRITSVYSNEPVNGLGDGNTTPDWKITGDLTVKLRAERSGNGKGREYTLTVECTDACGNSSTRTTKVAVPHDKGKKK